MTTTIIWILTPDPKIQISLTEARSSWRALPDTGTTEMEIFSKKISQLSVLPISTSTPTKYGASFLKIYRLSSFKTD